MITIRGTRLESLSLTRDDKEGEYKLTGQYALISSADRVLARQSINGYGDMKIEPSPATKKLITALITSLQSDLADCLGLSAAPTSQPTSPAPAAPETPF